MKFVTLVTVLVFASFVLAGHADAGNTQEDSAEQANTKKASTKKARAKKARRARRRARRARAKKARARRAKAARSKQSEEELMFEPDDKAPATVDEQAPATVDDKAPATIDEQAPAWLPEKSAIKRQRSSSLGEKSRRKTRFYIRAGVLHFAPNVSSDNIVLSDLGEYAELAVEAGPIPNSGADVDPLTIPVAIVGYVLPWLDRGLSVETVLGAPVTLNLKATGAMATESLAPYALGNIPTGVPALGEELGTAKALPLIVTVVYRFLPDQRFHPYAGVGLSYMHIFEAEITNPLLADVAKPRLEIGDSVGVVAQLGIEANIFDRYYATIDVKTLLGLRMTAVVHDVYIETPELPVFEMVRVGDATADISLLPIIVMLGVGADF